MSAHGWPWRPRIVFGQEPPPGEVIPPLTFRRPQDAGQLTDLTDPDLSGNGLTFSSSPNAPPGTSAKVPWTADDKNVALYAAAAVGALLIVGYALTR